MVLVAAVLGKSTRAYGTTDSPQPPVPSRKDGALFLGSCVWTGWTAFGLVDSLNGGVAQRQDRNQKLGSCFWGSTVSCEVLFFSVHWLIWNSVHIMYMCVHMQMGWENSRYDMLLSEGAHLAPKAVTSSTSSTPSALGVGRWLSGQCWPREVRGGGTCL